MKDYKPTTKLDLVKYKLMNLWCAIFPYVGAYLFGNAIYILYPTIITNIRGDVAFVCGAIAFCFLL